MYPLAQAQDSFYLKSDVELGGTDQKFNLLVGRDIQKHKKQNPQCVITMPLLEGIDGVEKMSKSYGNHIGFYDKPEDMYGKVLSIKDNMILKWFQLCTNSDVSTLNKIESDLKDRKINPMKIKGSLQEKLLKHSTIRRNLGLLKIILIK